ncbi:MAG: HelD family protein [Acidimicrobiales bacterium]
MRTVPGGGGEGAAVGAHPELEAEQAHVDRAYECLDRLRHDTEDRLRSVLDQGRGGTHQFREERDVIVRTSLARLDQLDIGEQALCFGRIDRVAEPGGREVFHIGRLGISAEDLEPLVVDWRAPVAEPFYRATGREPMGLVLRRHLAAQGRRIVGLEDERFSSGHPAHNGAQPHETNGIGTGPAIADDLEVGGPGALLAALEGARTGYMRDIVSTIQREQDEIIRAPLLGVLVVQGGPGTGKTAVALHRAAYLLYTHRFPLERQGVLVIGPNPLFLRYIEHVLPSLGESGVTLSTISGLVHGVQVRGEEAPAIARLKGDARMATVVARGVRSRQRPLRRSARIPFGAGTLRLTPELSASVVAAARRRPGTHNARRNFVEQLVVRRLADEYLRTLGLLGVERTATDDGHGRNGAGSAGGSEDGFELAEFSRDIRRVPELTEALDRMWPRLSAEEFLHDLYGAQALVGLAGKDLLTAAEQEMLVRPRCTDLSEIRWTSADLALLDEARVLLGPRRPRRHGAASAGSGADGTGTGNGANGVRSDPGEPRTYGHIVVDEAQDLSPMQLRMIGRRSLSGSITVVGDIAQATGAWAPRDWLDVTAHLPDQRPPRMVELTVSYRTPAEVIEVAARILAAAMPGMRPPTAVRRTGMRPRIVQSESGTLAEEAARLAVELVDEVAPGTVAVLAPASLLADLSVALDRTGTPVSDPRIHGLGAPLSLLPVDLANGLEFDAVVVVEPAAVAEESPQRLRALYVAVTRPTRRLVIVHSRPLPVSLN